MGTLNVHHLARWSKKRHICDRKDRRKYFAPERCGKNAHVLQRQKGPDSIVLYVGSEATAHKS